MITDHDDRYLTPGGTTAPLSQTRWPAPYLVLLKPGEVVLVDLCELLGALHHEVDEVAAAPQGAQDEEVGQHPKEPAQVDVLVLLVLLLVHDGLLHSGGTEEPHMTRTP